MVEKKMDKWTGMSDLQVSKACCDKWWKGLTPAAKLWIHRYHHDIDEKEYLLMLKNIARRCHDSTTLAEHPHDDKDGK